MTTVAELLDQLEARARDDRLTYRPKTAAKILDISLARLYELMTSGEIDSLKVGGTRLIRREALVAFLDRLEARAS